MLRYDKKSLKNKNELNYFDLDCTSASSLDRLVWQLCCVCVGRFILTAYCIVIMPSLQNFLKIYVS